MPNEKTIIRELASEYLEAACSPAQQSSNWRMLDTNDLKIVRPPVLIDEIPWHELESNPELVCRCEDEYARGHEKAMRRALFAKKYFRTDVLMRPYIDICYGFDVNPVGVERQEIISAEKGKRFEDMLSDESSSDLINEAVITRRTDLDEVRMNRALDLFGDSIPIKFVGPATMHSPIWDRINFLRGVGPIYEDLYDRPEHLHRIMRKLMDREIAIADFIDKEINAPCDPYDLHCTPGMISGRGASGLKGMWFRGMAQLFSCISPAMFQEFELDYIKPLAERCAYTYYGCCEPLHDRLEVLKKIKNLRKLGVSPWADVDSSAEQIGGAYVYARKPNPAHVAIRTDPDVVRKETEDTVKACIRYGCPLEFVLKDITTVSGDVRNLIVWAETVSEVLDAYYGK